ncbi:MAG: hypothetical protein ACK5P6_07855, partial [Pseudobdellovibrionaceae bacterium]
MSWLLFCGVAVFCLGKAILAVAFGTEHLVQVVPDDAFYYLQLAKNFAHTGQWTLDGIHPATGFHPLYAYFLVGLFKLGFESLHGVFL